MVEESDQLDLQYWRARAKVLEAEVDLLRELVWTLSADLPPERVVAAFEAVTTTNQLLSVGEGLPAPVVSDVKTELQHIWDSLLTPWRER